jgi:cytochrome c oxidase subunit III
VAAHAHAAGAHGLELEHHGPPAAHQSSRVNPAVLGMLLFIISEVMIFGAFFTAYFFIRVVGGAPWPGPGFDLPKLIAGANTCILVSSSFTIHYAQESLKKDNRLGLKVGMVMTFLLGATFLFIQINEYWHLGISPADSAQASIFYGLTGLHGAHVTIGLMLLAFVTIRSFRGHYSSGGYLGMEVPGIYWHFVDVMWIIVYFTVYII